MTRAEFAEIQRHPKGYLIGGTVQPNYRPNTLCGIIYSPSDSRHGLKAIKTGRNAFCSCGSGAKAKKCCKNYTRYIDRHTDVSIESNA